MNGHNIIGDSEDWSNTFTVQFMLDWRYYGDVATALINNYQSSKPKPWQRLTSADILRHKGYVVPRKKGQLNESKNGNAKLPSSNGVGGTIQWVNIKLTDEDVLELTASSETLEFLVASLMSVSDAGGNWSIRSTDDGKSVCCTIFGTVSSDSSRTYGLSSFAGDIHDAILCTLYKFRVKLDSRWELASELYSSEQSRPRFR